METGVRGTTCACAPEEEEDVEVVARREVGEYGEGGVCMLT
jgi:hypothetical protein